MNANAKMNLLVCQKNIHIHLYKCFDSLREYESDLNVSVILPFYQKIEFNSQNKINLFTKEHELKQRGNGIIMYQLCTIIPLRIK